MALTLQVSFGFHCVNAIVGKCQGRGSDRRTLVEDRDHNMKNTSDPMSNLNMALASLLWMLRFVHTSYESIGFRA